MPNNETLAFVEAVRLTLAYCGAEVFEDPQRFVTYLGDVTDSRSEEMRVLRNNCTVELLAPFKNADSMTSVDLKRAAAEAQEYLVEECLINAETSRSIVRGIAEGVALWRGLTIDWGDVGTGRGGVQNDVPPEAPSPRRRWLPLAVGIVALVLLGWAIVAALSEISDLPSKWIITGTTTDDDEGIWACTSYEEMLPNGEVNSTSTITYDSHGNKLSYDYEGLTEDDGVQTWSYTYGGYDSNGYPEWSRHNRTTYDADDAVTFQSRSSTNYTYETDKRGRLKTRTATEERSSWYTGPGWDDEPWHDVETTTYTYDGNSLVKRERRESSVSGDYKSEWITVTEYDRYGNVTHSNDRHSYDGEVSSMWDTSTTYQLDADGTPLSSKTISTNTYNDDTSVTVTISEYDEHGHVVKETRTEDGATTTTTYENKYDDNGNIVRRKNLTDGSVTTYEYLYIEDPSFAARHQNWW